MDRGKRYISACLYLISGIAVLIYPLIFPAANKRDRYFEAPYLYLGLVGVITLILIFGLVLARKHFSKRDRKENKGNLAGRSKKLQE